ncbi:MAG: BACON domain-containing carbohydrate-binding protein [Bacteroidota bacterium]
MPSIKPILICVFLLHFINSNASDVIKNLSLQNPKILNNRIAANGTVWDTESQKIIFSSNYAVSLTNSSIYYSTGNNTFIHSNTDGHLITQIPNDSFNYDPINGYLWNYSNNIFSAYSDSGLLITHFSFSGNYISTYSNEIRYNRNSKIYKYRFSDSTETLIGNYSGSNPRWFFDGGYFLTTQGTIVRLYNKDALLIKLVDIPNLSYLNGSGNYFWSYKKSSRIDIYQVNQSGIILSHLLSTGTEVLENTKLIGILTSGYPSFNIIDLTDTVPKLLTSKIGAGAYLETFNSDLAGNWTTSNSRGVVNYSSLTGQAITLNTGKIRSLYSNFNGYSAIATSNGKVLVYHFNEDSIDYSDTFNLTSSKVKLSLDGKYIASSGNAEDAQYYDGDLSLYIHKVDSQILLKKYYHNYFHDNRSDYLEDFDFSADGSLVSQRTKKPNSSGGIYSGYIANINSNDSILINSDALPLISPSGEYVATVTAVSDILKIYKNGVLNNVFSGTFGGWIEKDLFVFNQVDSIHTDKWGSITYYKPPVAYSTNGQPDTNYKLPTFKINNLIIISDSELYVNNSKVINIKTGIIHFSFDNAIFPSSPVGKNHLLYVKDNALKITNWRFPDFLNLPSTNLKVSSAVDSTQTFDILSNVDWTISCDQNWLTTSVNKGSGNSKVTLFITKNASSSPRTAIITVKGPDLLSQTIYVTQDYSFLNLSLTNLNVGPAADSIQTFDISSNVDWTVSSNQSWLTPNINNGTGNSKVTLFVTANSSANSRTATITVKGKDLPLKTIAVTQKNFTTSVTNLNKEEDIILYPNPFKTSFYIKINEPFVGDYKIQIINACGILLSSNKLKSTDEEIDMQMFPIGIYTVVIVKDDLKKYFKMAVKE